MRRRAITALVAAAFLSIVTACSSGEPETAAEPPTSASTSASPSASSSSSSAQGEDVVADPPSKTWEDAVEAARQSFDGKVDKIELETAGSGGLEYKVEQLSATQEHAAEYDANSLDRVSESTEDLDRDDAAKKQQETFDPDEVDGTITTWKAEGKDTGKVIYEFDILPKGSAANADDTEVQVDAMDGSIVKDS